MLPVSTVMSLLSKLTPARLGGGPGWWTYLGSFGDDFFGDDSE